MPAMLPTSAARLYQWAALAKSTLHADAVVVHDAEVHHRRRMAGLARPGEQAHALEHVLVDAPALHREHAQAIVASMLILGGGGAIEPRGLRRVLIRPAAFEGCARERCHGLHVAAVRGLAVPDRRLGVVAGHALPVRYMRAQAVHDVGVAALAQPTQPLHEVPFSRVARHASRTTRSPGVAAAT